MDESRFTSRKSGQLVPIKIQQVSESAFIPDPLPPKWEFPNSLWPKLANAKEALGRLDGIGRTLANPHLLLSPLRRLEAITSSRLEGTYATAQQLFLFELDPKEPKSKTDQVNAWKEVSNYNYALSHGDRLLKNMPFCLRLAKELHSTLLSGVRGRRSNPGEFRQHQVAIGSDRRLIPPPITHLADCLDRFERYMNSDDTRFDPLVKAFLVHYQFEAIHPFGDGNGRIGRVLLSLMIAKWCKHEMPLLYMSAFFERYKDEYIDNLFRISTEGAWEKWIDFCLTGTIRQAKDAISRCDRLNSLKETMPKRLQAGSPRTHQIIQDLFDSPYLRVRDICKRFNIVYQTARSDLDKLVEAGILRELEDLRPRTYYSPEILSIAYDSNEEFL